MTIPYTNYGPTTGFRDAQRYGALLVLARFTIYSNGVPLGSPYTANMSVGSVTIDRNSATRRSGEITIEVLPTIPPSPLTPTNPSSLLAPFGNEIFVETGISAAGANIPGNQTQWMSNGMFAIATSTIEDTGLDMTVTLQVYDRSWTIAQRALRNPYNFPATGSGNFVAEIQALLNMVWNEQAGVPPLQYNIVPTSAIVPTASYDQGSNPWQAAMDMANAIGYELYFDTNGVVVGKPIPNPYQQQPSWVFTDDTHVVGVGGTGSTALLGDAYSNPIEVSVEMTRDGIFNDIVVQGTGTSNAAVYNSNGLETTSQPLLAEAADTNPQSPTYIGGAMGDVPNFVQSSLVTAAGAQQMANNDLQVALSAAWKCTLTIAPNPALDVDQVVVINRPRVGLNYATMVIDTITQVWNYADTMAITGRILTNNGAI